MNAEKRRWLAVLTLVIIVVILGFLWVINKGQPVEMQAQLNTVLIILSCFALVVLMLFIFFGEIFTEDGHFLKNEITFIITAVICIMQVTLAFATYSFKQLDFENKSLQKAKAIYTSIKPEMLQEGFTVENTAIPDEISAIYVIDEQGLVLDSSNKALLGQALRVDPLKSYRFLNGNQTVVMDISAAYQKQIIGKIFLDLLTVLVASIILTYELVIFAMKLIESRFDRKQHPDDKKSHQMVGYVRQIAFLFYFSSRMSSAFITIIAKNLGGSFFGLKDNVLAGIPQSAEFLLTCVAIFATSILIEKKGWKISFVGGLFIVTIGSVMSAYSSNILFFILSRGVVGLGYGFCWMTLRNFALFTSNEKDKSICFAMLNAGIYAGINCGAVFGSILADIIGYKPVLLVASALTAACTLAVMGFENAKYRKPAAEKPEHRSQTADCSVPNKTAVESHDPLSSAVKSPVPQNTSGKQGKFRQVRQLIAFVILMVLPSCILGSYLSYYLPIYFTGMGKMTSDIGRVQLIYGLAIVYIGPYVVKLLNKRPNLFLWNLGYNGLFSLALILFGTVGGFIPAMAAVLAIGIADSFGFITQNNYFLGQKIMKQQGESRALSYLSVTKKFAEMLGPVAFGLSFAIGDFRGVAVLGIIFALAAILYVLINQSEEFFRRRKAA